MHREEGVIRALICHRIEVMTAMVVPDGGQKFEDNHRQLHAHRVRRIQAAVAHHGK